MARPIKKGLEYYPQDTDIHSDIKIRRLRTEFGAVGYLVYDYIKCLCYKENGYWVGYDDGFCFDVADVLKSGTTENSVREILKGCFRMSLFNSEVFRVFRIITSAGIQKRFLLAKRGGVIDEKYNCVVNKSLVIAVETPGNDDLSTQSKLKESKVKDRERAPEIESEEFIDFKKFIESNAPNVGKMKEVFTEKQYKTLLSKYSTAVTKKVLTSMHNRASLLKDYNSAYLTCLKWCERETK